LLSRNVSEPEGEITFKNSVARLEADGSFAKQLQIEVRLPRHVVRRKENMAMLGQANKVPRTPSVETTM